MANITICDSYGNNHGPENFKKASYSVETITTREYERLSTNHYCLDCFSSLMNYFSSGVIGDKKYTISRLP